MNKTASSRNIFCCSRNIFTVGVLIY